MLDQTVRSYHDVERGLGLPLLGRIPRTRVRKGERVYEPLVSAKVSVVSEAFRDLRTMVALAKASESEPCLLVTSSVQEEGKSFVAANLAVAHAQLGRKVLLIDGDLRRPSQHVILSAEPERGLADFLAGKVKDPSDVLQKIDVPHLEVLFGGSKPSDPSELLNAEQLAALVLWARERYDRVIVDCPPVFPVSDVLLWGRHVRSSIIVSRAGRTRVALVRTACDRLRSGGIDILGGVLNGAPASPGRGELRDFERYCRAA